MSVRWVPGTNILRFDVRVTSDSENEWDALLSRPFGKEKGFAYSVPVSVGYENESPLRSQEKHPLEIINKTWFWIFVVFFAFVVLGIIRLAKTSAILRDGSYKSPEGKLGTFSLGRTQMAYRFPFLCFSLDVDL